MLWFQDTFLEIDHLKTVLMRNSYPSNFIDSCIISFLDKLYTTKFIVQNVPKRKVFVKLLFFGSTSFQIRKKFKKLFTDKLTSCKVKLVSTSHATVESFLTFLDKLPKMLLSGLVYKYKCGGCNVTYYGKTKRYLGISHLTGKKVKIDNNKLTAIQKHLLYCYYSPSGEKLYILIRETNNFNLGIMESLLIQRDKPVFSKADSSLPLELFWYNIHG